VIGPRARARTPPGLWLAWLVAALALLLGATPGHSGKIVVAAGGLAIIAWALTHRRLRAAWGGVGRRDVQRSTERLDGCALAPGVAVHVVRWNDRTFLVGATQRAVTLLAEATDCDGSDAARSETCAAAVCPSETRRGAIRGAALLLCLAAAVVLSVARSLAVSAQSESTNQSTEMHRPESAAPRPPAFVPGELPFIVPESGRRPRAAPFDAEPPPGATFLWLAGLALVPFVLMAVTSFVKVSVVLSLVRNAIGAPQAPSDPVLAGISLALTLFVMAPVTREISEQLGAQPADFGSVHGLLAVASVGAEPIRSFLQRNARSEEVSLFVELSDRGDGRRADPGSFAIIIPAFVTSELREAFIVGFFIFVPFLVVDLVVSNILMSMGMVMVSPATVALPFKLMLFVLIDGWPMLMKGLALSYR
jgi:type III secretion apparatus YscR/HrcR family protein